MPIVVAHPAGRSESSENHPAEKSVDRFQSYQRKFFGGKPSRKLTYPTEGKRKIIDSKVPAGRGKVSPQQGNTPPLNLDAVGSGSVRIHENKNSNAMVHSCWLEVSSTIFL